MQSTQALARLAAKSMPQHVIRGTVVPAVQREAYDASIDIFWRKLLGETADFDRARKTQLHLPLREGGFSAGGVAHRADAAFLAGSLNALDEVKSAAGVACVEQLRATCPGLCSAMDLATTALQLGGVTEDVSLWQSDQPLPAKGRQRRWMCERRLLRRKRCWSLLRYATQLQCAQAQQRELPAS